MSHLEKSTPKAIYRSTPATLRTLSNEGLDLYLHASGVSEDPEDVLLKGYFRVRKSHKQSHLLTNWVKRYVILTPTLLTVYTSTTLRKTIRTIQIGVATEHGLVLLAELHHGTGVAFLCSGDPTEEPMYMTTVSGTSGGVKGHHPTLTLWNETIRTALIPFHNARLLDTKKNLSTVQKNFQRWRAYREAGTIHVKEFWNASRGLHDYDVNDANLIHAVLTNKMGTCGGIEEYKREVDVLVALALSPLEECTSNGMKGKDTTTTTATFETQNSAMLEKMHVLRETLREEMDDYMDVYEISLVHLHRSVREFRIT